MHSARNRQLDRETLQLAAQTLTDVANDADADLRTVIAHVAGKAARGKLAHRIDRATEPRISK